MLIYYYSGYNVNPTLQKRIKMKENKAYPSQIRPLPYFNSAGSPDDYRLAAALRRESNACYPDITWADTGTTSL